MTSRRTYRVNGARAVAPPSRRRGVAMLLVIVALAVGTVLGGAMLSSRDNSPAIGKNARDYAAASWSAQAATGFALAALETTVDWQALTGGDLLTDFPIAGGTASAVVTNLQGQPAGPDDREGIVTITARVGDMTSVIQRRVSLVAPGPIDQSISPYLDEFAAFAAAAITLDDDTEIKPYQGSPEADTLFPIKVGTGFSTLGAMNIGSNTKLPNVGLFVDANASPALLGAATGDLRFGRGGALPLSVPALPVALPAEILSLPIISTFPITVAILKFLPPLPGQPVLTIPGAGKYGPVSINSGFMRIDEANGRFYEFESLDIALGAKLQIVGKVTIHIKGKLNLAPNSTVELAGADSAVRFLTSEDVTIDNATFGMGNAFPTLPRDPNTLTNFFNPARFRLLAVDEASGGKPTPIYDFKNNAVLLACVHAPTAIVTVDQNSAIIGRVTAADLSVKGGSSILYTPQLDSRLGYSAFFGPAYENMALIPEVAAELALVIPGEGAEGLTTRVRNKSKAKWIIDSALAWFVDDDEDISIDPFDNNGPIVIPPLIPVTIPMAPTPRFAGKVFSAPIPTGARALEN